MNASPTSRPSTVRCRLARGGLAGVVLTWVALSTPPLSLRAHTPITTKYRFDTDVLPVLERRCVRCHSPGGPTPMPLRTYNETRPWAESIKEQLLARNMPPLFVEHGSVPVSNGTPLTARELDILVDWASGGAPDGATAPRTKNGEESSGGASGTRATDPASAAGRPEATRASTGDASWRFTEFRGFLSPDDQNQSEVRTEHRVDQHRTAYLTGWRIEDDPRWLRGATLWVEIPGEDRATMTFLGSWVAGDEPVSFPPDAAFEIAPQSTIRVSAYYKRTWLLRSKKLAPRTRLAMRFADEAPARSVVSTPIPLASEPPRVVDGVALAYYPSASRAGTLLLETNDSSRSLLELYRVSRDWPITYRFAAPPPVGGLMWRPDGESTQDANGGYALYLIDH